MADNNGSRLAYQRWEKKKGIKVLCYLRTVRGKHVGTGMMRGKEYNVTGSSNSEVLNRLFQEFLIALEGN